jgi:hypothetical protein
VKIVAIDSAVLRVPTPKPIPIPDRPGHGMALAPGAARKYRLG